MDNNPYISCIRIDHRPILPPLITPQVREECLEYKRKAMELEKKLQRNVILRKCLEDLEKLEHHTESLSKSCTLESQLAFEEDPLNKSEKLQNLSTETVDISEYVSEGVKVLGEVVRPIEKLQPKLIRSNSYTLESPSPILLAHLEKEAKRNQCDSAENKDSLSPVTVIDNSNGSNNSKVIETDVRLERIILSGPNEMVNLVKDSDFMPIINHLPEDYAQHLIEFLGKHKKNSPSIKSDGVSVSVSSTQSLHYSFSSDSETIHENNFQDEVKKEWAASVIGAAVRGYLVRRLIRTEKVQSLIETLKDVVLCALELHNSRVIDECDVELHRRLLQQVSAACYAFHDIFFALSTKEQMSIISMDRRRLKERANRPLSARSSRASSARLMSAR